VKLGFGTEARWENLRFVNDRSDRTGGWLQATPRQPFSARSTTDGLFAEIRVPIFGEGNAVRGAHLLEASVAGRKDIYSITSDPFVPKYTLRWLPFNDEFAIRGTYSESFSAPTLYEVRGPISAGFTSGINITRYDTSGASMNVSTGSRQYRSRSGSNPDLDPSESRNWTAGIVWSPKRFTGLEVAADWFSIDERSLIGVIPSSTIVQSVEELGPNSPYASYVRLGQSQAGEVHFDTGQPIASSGQMSNRPSDEVWITNQLLNLAGVWQQGMDLRVSYRYDTQSWGVLNAQVNGIYLYEYNVQNIPDGDIDEYAGTFAGSTLSSLRPRYRTVTNLSWSFRDIHAGLTHTFVPSVDDVNWTEDYRVKRYHRFDLHAGYTFSGNGIRWLEGLTASVGVNNVFNKYPPLTPSEGSQSHDINGYDPIGRLIWVQAKYKF
jgi:iron complex outermembrane recepter protein